MKMLKIQSKVMGWEKNETFTKHIPVKDLCPELCDFNK